MAVVKHTGNLVIINHIIAIYSLHFTEHDTYHRNELPRQNGHYFADDIFKLIFLNGYVWIFIQISLTYVPKIPIDNHSAFL